MKVTLKHFDDREYALACQTTVYGGTTSVVPLARMAAAEHSPIRVVRYQFLLEGIPSFVSVHLVRHHEGVDNYVETHRVDRGATEIADRNTPVNMAMTCNVAALIYISRKRLCLKASKETRQVWRMVRQEVRKVTPEIADLMVPECVYRNGLCPELAPCAPGPSGICKAYRPWPGVRGKK